MKLISKENKVNIKGILLHGPSGIGKTLAIENVLDTYSIHKIILTPKHLI